MDIKLLGFELEVGKGISLVDLFDYIATTKGSPIVFYKYGRFLYVEDLGQHYAGLLITTKDQKKFIEFEQHAGTAKLEPRDVTQGSQIADFNYFLVNKKTGRGLYQYYHNSCSIDTFASVCKRHYDNLKESQIKAAISALAQPTPSKQRQCRSMFAGTLTWNVLVRPEAFRDMVSDLKSIKSLTVTVTTLAFKQTIFSPIANHAKRMTQTFRFPANTAPVPALLGEIDALVGLHEVDAARIEGQDKDGRHHVLKVDNTPDSFGVYDYDTIASKMDLRPDDFVNSDFMKELIKVAGQKKTLFH
jgi:hypothetical protein